MYATGYPIGHTAVIGMVRASVRMGLGWIYVYTYINLFVYVYGSRPVYSTRP